MGRAAPTSTRLRDSRHSAPKSHDDDAIYLFLKSAVTVPILIGHWSTGRLYYANDAAAALLGVDAKLLEGMSALQFFANAAQRTEVMRRLREEKGTIQVELRMRSFDERDIWVLASVGRIVYAGEPSLILVLNDFTQYKEQELRLTEARNRLRNETKQLSRETDRWRDRLQAEAKASRAKSRFLAQMSHELRSPLNAILGFAEIIRDGALGPRAMEKYASYAGYIHEAGTHLLGLINDVLDLSKIEAERLELERTWFALDALIDECAVMMRPVAERRGIELRTEVAADAHVFADRRRVKQMIVNLVSNAIKFTLSGGSVRVNVLGNGDEESVIISVEDTGVGMTEDQLALALEPFGQIPTIPGVEAGGTGLGLPIVKSLIEAHGGSLEIESRPKQGTTVRLIFAPPGQI